MQVSKISFQGDLYLAKEKGHKIVIGDKKYEKGKEYALFIDSVDDATKQKHSYEKPQIVKLLEFIISSNNKSKRIKAEFETRDKKKLTITDNANYLSFEVNNGRHTVCPPKSAKMELCDAEEVKDRIENYNNKVSECKNLLVAMG